MPNTHPYEDSDIRQRVISVANLQSKNKVVVESTTPEHGGLPLPTLNGIDTRGEQWPYVYGCEWGKFSRADSNLYGLYEFTPNNGALPPAWEPFDLSTPLQAVTAVVDRVRHIATVKTVDQELTLQEVNGNESGYVLIEHINANLATHHIPLVVWRIEWLDGESGRLWNQDMPPKVRNHQTQVYATGFATDSDHHLIYLGMVGYKTSLDSIRATLQASRRQHKYITLGGTIVYPYGHYIQNWSALPDYNNHHAVMITSAALPGRWLPDDMLTYLLVFDGETEGQSLIACLTQQLVGRLSEALTIPILPEWADALWAAGQDDDLITELKTGGDCLVGWQVALTEENWVKIVQRLLGEHKIFIK